MLQKILATFFLFLLASLAGCGGGGSSGSSGDTLSGTAATGAPFDGYVYVVDADGIEVNVAVAADGSFELPVDGMSPPFLIKAVPNGAGPTLYSWAGAANQTANVTQLTTLALYLTYSGNLGALYNSWSANITEIALNALRDAQAVVNANFATLLSNAGLAPTTYDFFTAGFRADGSGFDGVLDLLDIAIDFSGNSFQVAVSGKTFSFDGSISITGFNIGGIGSGSGGGSGSGNVCVVNASYSVAGVNANYKICYINLPASCSEGALGANVSSALSGITGSFSATYSSAGTCPSDAALTIDLAAGGAGGAGGSGGSTGGGGTSGGSAPGPDWDPAECALQPNGNYLCTPAVFGAFGPYTIESTGSSLTCTIEYDGVGTMNFAGGGKVAALPVTQFAVSTYTGGGLANAVLVSGRMSFHVNESNRIDSVVYNDVDFSRVTCLDVSS